MTLIGELAVNAVVRTEGVERGAKNFRSEVRGMGDVAKAATPIIAGLGAAVTAMYAITSERAAKFDRLVNDADRLGIGAERLQELNYAAGQSSNVEDLAGNMANLGKRVSEASNGLGKAVGAINELNLDARQLASLGIDEQFLTIADAMQGMAEDDRISIATRLGLDSGLVTMLGEGRDGIQQMTNEARQMGFVLDETNSRSLAATNDELDKMRAALEHAGDAAAASFAPGMTWAANQATSLIGMIQDLGYAIGAISMGKTRDEMAAIEQQARVDYERNLARDREARQKRVYDAAETGRLRRQEVAERETAIRKQQEAEDRAKSSLQKRLEDARNRVGEFGQEPSNRVQIAELRKGTDNFQLRQSLIGQLELLDRLNAERERGIKAQERDQQLQQRASSIIEQQRTPMERLKMELAEIRELWATGKLDPTQFGKAIGEAQNRFKAELANGQPKEQRQPLNVLKFGSSEAYRAIRESRNQDKDKTPVEQLKELKEANKIAKETLDAIRNDPGLQVAKWN